MVRKKEAEAAATPPTYEVVHARVAVRSEASMDGKYAGTKLKGDIVTSEPESEDGWIRMLDGTGYLPVDGAAMGVKGPLLRRKVVPPPASDEELERRFALADGDGSGQIDWDEYVAMEDRRVYDATIETYIEEHQDVVKELLESWRVDQPGSGSPEADAGASPPPAPPPPPPPPSPPIVPEEDTASTPPAAAPEEDPAPAPLPLAAAPEDPAPAPAAAEPDA